MVILCGLCRSRQAITSEGLCEECSLRSVSPLPFAATAALSVTALMLGAAFFVDRLLSIRDESRTPLFGRPEQWGKKPSMLAAFSRDMTAEAREQLLDPVVGRDEEIERVIAILSRRNKNNPVLLGEPGVGKTAIVEGLANRIAAGSVPGSLIGKRLLSLSVAKLVAGTKYRGEFEGRVKRMLDEVRAASREIILFIDELHLLVGAGGAEGAMDLSSMLKPELARGELQCIGATTFDEYRRYIEVDAALERRFQPVTVAEPSVDATIAILQALRDRYARHHGVSIDDAAIEAAVVLSARYIAERNLPDKAIDVMDEAAAAAALHGSRMVDAESVAAVVAKWTRIPQSHLTVAQSQDLLALETRLGERIIGQAEAIARVAESVRRSRAGLKDPRKPVGSFFFAGPPGVGKTELARAIAAELFGDEEALVRIDLSEYTEPHAISRLIGAPPGYAGHDEAGQLSEPVRRRPYSVVLFDEIEKAHHDVASLLLQILDEGRLTDAKGRVIEFRHAIVIFTGTLDRSTMKRVMRGELLNRVDESIAFNPLGRAEIEQIVDLELRGLRQRLTGREIELEWTPAARELLAEASIAAGEGARSIGRTIGRLVTTPLSSALLRGDLSPHARLLLERNGDELSFTAG
jgi:ATP-dependent Clp protease ATP-binding subunit ClpC